MNDRKPGFRPSIKGGDPGDTIQVTLVARIHHRFGRRLATTTRAEIRHDTHPR